MGLPGVETLPVLCRGCEQLVDFDNVDRIGGQLFCKECAREYSHNNPEPHLNHPSVNWFHIIWGIGCLIVGIAGFSYCSDQMNRATEDMYTNYSWGKAMLAVLAILGIVELLVGFLWKGITKEGKTPERSDQR